MCHASLMHCRCGKPYDVSQKSLHLEKPVNGPEVSYVHRLHLELHSNNFRLALTETDKQTFEMSGSSDSENVIGDAAKHILECLELSWVGKICLQL